MEGYVMGSKRLTSTIVGKISKRVVVVVVVGITSVSVLCHDLPCGFNNRPTG